MSNASLKEQLEAVVSHFSDDAGKENKPKKKMPTSNKPPQRPSPPKPKWLDYAQYGVELLRAYFPACFKPNNEVKPLKKGIKQDLLIRLSTIDTIVTEDKACMVKSLSYYVNTIVYHKSVIEGVMRIDLDGNPAGVVSAEEARYSAERNQAKSKTKQLAAASQVKTDCSPEIN
jgi:ProP effector